MDSKSIIDAVTSVTKSWAKQRKSEERNSRAYARREYYYSDRVNFSDIADEILPEAYAHASGQGQYTVSKRQMYYASREKFKEMTGRDIDASYFSQTILVQYLNRHDVDWKITADPRGTFMLPNTAHEVRIPVGTIAIEKYLTSRLADHELGIGGQPIEWPSERENERFAALLYIEKEGFEPLLKEARIAERFDLAIMSCKGQGIEPGSPINPVRLFSFQKWRHIEADRINCASEIFFLVLVSGQENRGALDTYRKDKTFTNDR